MLRDLIFLITLTQGCVDLPKLFMGEDSHDDLGQENLDESAPFYKEKNLETLMRDGVILKSDCVRPKKSGKFPTLIYRTPYDKADEYRYNLSTISKAVKRGYAVLVQDVRGRFESAGTFIPYVNDPEDGYDTIEWAARQEWSDGRIGTFGVSYPGGVQWLAATKNPPHLKAIVPGMIFAHMAHYIFFGGIFDASWAWWTWHYIAPGERLRKNLSGPKTYEEAEEEWERLGVEKFMGELPTLAMSHLRDVAPYFYEWQEKGPRSEDLKYADIRRFHDNIDVAVLNLSGWHDEAYGPYGAVTNFNGLMKHRKTWKDPKTALLLGPWTHGAKETELDRAGDRFFGKGAVIDYDDLVLDWLDVYVRDVPVKNFPWKEGARVRGYLMGADRWSEGNTFPLESVRPKTWYLGAGAKGLGLSSSRPLRRHRESKFVADPADPVEDKADTTFGAYDLSYLKDRSDLLTFESQPLEEDFDILGAIESVIYVKTTAVDFDLYLKVLDVSPKGVAFNLMAPAQEGLRASEQEGYRRSRKPDEVLKFKFDHLLTGNRFKKGHRIRVHVLASFFPDLSPNLQTGLSETLSDQVKAATINILHSRRYPSKLSFPNLKEASP